MNRQQRRSAERLLEKGRFPFPEFQEWLRGWLRNHPEVFAQIQGKEIYTNMSGESETVDVAEFRALIEAQKEQDDYERDNQTDTGETRDAG